MSTPLRVLFIEDSEDDVLLLTRQLRVGGYAPAFERVETADGLRSALHRGGWEVIISDYSMPRFNGMEALSITLETDPDVPFLLISGTVGEEVAVESVKAGAADYLMKQNLIRFVPAVARALRDATERKAMRRAEAVLREQRSLLSLIYDNSFDALLLYNWEPGRAAWVLASLNRIALRMIHGVEPGLTEADLIGESVEDVLRRTMPPWPAARADILDAFHRAAEAGRPETHEHHLGGGPAGGYVEVIAIPFHGPAGRSRHVLVVCRDVTDRLTAEADRRTFEARVADARKMEALGQLAGGVAHDFNNILTGILGFADVIQKTAADPAIRGFGGEVLRAARRAKDLVRQILMFSRRHPPERRPLRLADVVREAIALVAGAAPASTRIDLDLPYVLGDATQLHQVVMNLGVNAVQAMGETGGRLEITLDGLTADAEFARRHPPLRPGPCVRLTVADTGPGVPPTVLDHLFEPFFTTKAPGVGTGLGLSVVHGVVQNHDGAIAVHSRPGSGTTFEVFLPAVTAPPEEGEPPVTEKPRATAGKRVLFVDDEASIARLAQVMLKSLGHTASTFGRPEDGLAALRADPTGFDVLVTDLTMPGMTGVDLARLVRDVRADLPIILSSGYADDVPEETLRALGIVKVLPKPFHMQALGDAVAAATL